MAGEEALEAPADEIKGQRIVRWSSFVVLVLLGPLIYAFAYEANSFLRSNVIPLLVSWFTFGLLVYVLVDVFLLHGTTFFLEVFEHEVGHSLAGLLFWRHTKKMVVEQKEGLTLIPTKNPLIILAPYYLSLFTIPLLPLKLFLPPSVHEVVNFLIGFTLGFHYVSLAREFRPDQPDIERAGFPFSLCVTFILNLIFLVVVICVVADDYSGIPAFFKDSFVRAPEYYEAVLQAIIEALSGARDAADSLKGL
jgi:hypothetical protein